MNLNHKKKRSQTFNSLKINENTITNTEKIANVMNEYYINVERNLAQKIEDKDAHMKYKYKETVTKKSLYL